MYDLLINILIYTKRHPALRYVFLFFSAGLFGAIGAYAMPPTGFWPLLFISLSGFYLVYSLHATTGQAFWTGLGFGFGYHVSGLWWIGNALLVEGSSFGWAWPLAVAGLPLLLALFTAIFTACAAILGNPRTIAGFIALILCLGLADWVRGHAFTGFPWNVFAYGWTQTLPIAQSVSILGPYGLNIFTLFWAMSLGFMAIASLQLKTKILTALVAAASAAMLFSYGTYSLNQSPTILRADTAVHIVQPNIPQAEKWQRDKLVDNFEKHLALSVYEEDGLPTEVRAARNHIIIWPETAMPPVLIESPAVRERLQNMLKTYPGNASLLSGALLRHPDEAGQTVNYTNSLIAVSENEPVQALYHKTHLVPFGEYIPFQDLIPLETVTGFQGFKPGNGPETFFLKDIPAFSPLICYEIIFPGKMTDRGMPASWLLTVTNDAWYGVSPGPYQHFAKSIFRAIEQGTPVVRSANTGISGLVDSHGRVLFRSALNTEERVSALLPHLSENQTFFTTYRHSLFFLLCGLLTVLLLLSRRSDPS